MVHRAMYENGQELASTSSVPPQPGRTTKWFNGSSYMVRFVRMIEPTLLSLISAYNR